MTTPAPQTFGQWLKRRRSTLGLTQKALAQLAGCSLAAIKKLEGDERRPSHQVAGLLAAALQLSDAHQALFVRVARGEAALARLPAADAAAEAEAAPAAPPADAEAAPLPPAWPVPPTPLVGREHELATIDQLLAQAACRLLTLTGPGGSGKTRLALEAAQRLRPSFPAGLYFTPLAGVSAPELLGLALADALGLSLAAGDPTQQLLNYLRARPQRLLLVLDNLEHLLAGVGLLAEILKLAPQVTLLVTSREPLGLQAEWALEVQGLPIPESAQPAVLAASSAAELFVQRARQAQVGFVLAPDDYAALARISRLVAGLPLGLELAATWVRTLTCPEIAEEIERGLSFLATAGRDAPERHRSIEAVCDYSWRLLTPAEQRGLRQLAVFHGGFERAAAEPVAEAPLTVLSALVAKSLLRRTAAGRYDLHELIRQYAAARLAEAPGEAEAARARHSTYYLHRLAASEPALRSPAQRATLAALLVELDNIRAAWQTAVDTAALEAVAQAAAPLLALLEVQQNFTEGLATFQRAADRLRAVAPAATLGRLLNYAAYFNMRMGRNREALALFEESLPLLPAAEAPSDLSFGRLNRGVVVWALGNFDEAARDLAEARQLAHAHGPVWQAALATGFAGGVSHDQGDYATAHTWLTEAMALCRRAGDPHQTVIVGIYLSRTALAVGRPAEAEAVLREVIALAQASGNRWGEALGLERMGVIALEGGRVAEAAALLEQSVAAQRAIGDPWSLGWALNALGRAALAGGDLARAEAAALEALALTARAEHATLAIEALVNLAAGRARQGRPAEAREYALLAANHPAGPLDAKARAQQLLAELPPPAPGAAEPPARTFEAAVAALLAQAGH